MSLTGKQGIETGRRINTVLGAVPAADAGVIAVHEVLLSIVPGAQFAPDIRIDRADVFDALAAKLTDFREAGGSTIVDSGGMYHGRDLPLYEALSRATGVHIVASTGMGPEELLGGYFLTPQTNPPTPWPAERFAELFVKEAEEGMVLPRVERRAAAGLITTTASHAGMTATDESLCRGAARAAASTGVAVSIRPSRSIESDVRVVRDERIAPARVLVGGLDRSDATFDVVASLASLGFFLGIDHVGWNDDPHHIDDRARVQLVRALIDAGHAERIVLSCNAVGVAKGHPESGVAYGHLLSVFAPMLAEAGVADEDIRRILEDNPRELLTVEGL